MDLKTREQLADYLHPKLHEHCSGYMFGADDVLDYINDFFKVKELIDQRDKIQKEIDNLTK